MSLLCLVPQIQYRPSNKYPDQYSNAVIPTPPRPISFLSPTFPSSPQRCIPRKCQCLLSSRRCPWPFFRSLLKATYTSSATTAKPLGDVLTQLRRHFGDWSHSLHASGQGSCSPARNLKEESRFTTPRLWTQPTAGSNTTCFDAR